MARISGRTSGNGGVAHDSAQVQNRNAGRPDKPEHQHLDNEDGDDGPRHTPRASDRGLGHSSESIVPRTLDRMTKCRIC